MKTQKGLLVATFVLTLVLSIVLPLYISFGSSYYDVPEYAGAVQLSTSPTPFPTPNPIGLPSFRVTSMRLYDTPRVIEPLSETVTFVLERQGGNNWTSAGTANSSSNGWVNFMVSLFQYTTYRLRVVSAPIGWEVPTGYWLFFTGTGVVGTPTSHGGNQSFVNNPPGHSGLHVGLRPLPSPSSPTPTPFPANYTIIRNAGQLAAIGGPQSAGRTFVLANDIAITFNDNWTPIEDFRGTLDGAGHVITIESIYVSNHMATAGLFGCIREGTVVIRNLGVRTTRNGSIVARAPSSGNSRAFAGGIIGSVIGGDVTIENSFFNGNVRAISNYDRKISGLLSNPFKYSLLMVAGGIAPWAKIAIESVDMLYTSLMPTGSHSYAGGLIGFIGGNADVNIINSHANGRASSEAYMITVFIIDFPVLFGNTTASTFSGGLVGINNFPARLTIYNSYVTNDIQATTHAPTVRSCGGAHLGSLVGNDRINSVLGRSYRLDTQGLWGNTPAGFRNRVNSNVRGTTALSRSAMQNSGSFAGWDFNEVWAIDSERNGGLPFPRIFDPHLDFSALRLLTIFAEGISYAIGSGIPFTVEIDMPFSYFSGIQVNGMDLTRDVHFTTTPGSIRVNLLPSFLNTLEDGFHLLTVNFTDGTSTEEQFLITEAEAEVPHIYRMYINSTLVYLNGEPQFDEYYLDLLYDNMRSIRVELEDGRIVENSNVHIESPSTIYGNFTIPNPHVPLSIELRQGSATGALISAFVTPAAHIEPLSPMDFAFDNIAHGTYSLIFRQPGHTSFTINNIVISEDNEIINLTQDPRFPQQLPLRPGDVRGHGQVNISDLSILLQNWSGDYINANFTGSGQINISDLNMLLQNWMAEAVVVD